LEGLLFIIRLLRNSKQNQGLSEVLLGDYWKLACREDARL